MSKDNPRVWTRTESSEYGQMALVKLEYVTDMDAKVTVKRMAPVGDEPVSVVHDSLEIDAREVVRATVGVEELEDE